MVSRFFRLNRSGFTLIELIVVMAVTGILITAGLTSYQGTQRSSRDARRRADLEGIRQALEVYKSSSGVYPGGAPPLCDSSLGGLECGCRATTACAPVGIDWSAEPQIAGMHSDLSDTLEPTYIRNLPVDPVNDATHFYYYFPVCGTISYNLCGNAVKCMPGECCAYEMGTFLERTNTWYAVCNPTLTPFTPG